MLLSKKVEVEVKQKNTYLEKIGYFIPKEKKQLWFQGKKNGSKYIIPKDTKILVKVEDLSKGSNTIVQVQCDNCGKIYELKYNRYLKQSELHNGELYCCDCANSVLFSGKNNNLYNHNKSDEERYIDNELLRHIDGYSDFIKKVLNKFNYSCYICGSKDNLVVHHLDGYDWCKEKRTDVNNGVCLCNKCHKSFHSKFGYKNSKKEDFDKFIECEYKPNEKLKEQPLNISYSNRVICLETLEIFNSAYECDIIVNHNFKNGRGTAISSCCKRKGTCGGRHYLWYDEYIKMTQKEVLNVLNQKEFSQPNKRKQVICIELKLLFNSVTEATKYMNKVSTSNLSGHLKGKRGSFCGYHWCYLEEYKDDIKNVTRIN